MYITTRDGVNLACLDIYEEMLHKQGPCSLLGGSRTSLPHFNPLLEDVRQIIWTYWQASDVALLYISAMPQLIRTPPHDDTSTYKNVKRRIRGDVVGRWRTRSFLVIPAFLLHFLFFKKDIAPLSQDLLAFLCMFLLLPPGPTDIHTYSYLVSLQDTPEKSNSDDEKDKDEESDPKTYGPGHGIMPRWRAA